MSEEVAAAIGDIAYWQRRAERAEAEGRAIRRLVAGREDQTLLEAVEAVAGLQPCGHIKALLRYDEEEGCTYCHLCEAEHSERAALAIAAELEVFRDALERIQTSAFVAQARTIAIRALEAVATMRKEAR